MAALMMLNLYRSDPMFETYCVIVLSPYIYPLLIRDPNKSISLYR